jgi:hypothetical protein
MQANEGSKMRKKVGILFFLSFIAHNNLILVFSFQILIGIHFDAI